MNCYQTVNDVCTVVVSIVHNLYFIGFPTPTARVAQKTAPATPRQSAPLGAGSPMELVPTVLGSAAHVWKDLTYNYY